MSKPLCSRLLVTFNLVLLISCDPNCDPIPACDKDLIQVALNLEFLEAEFFLYGALGKGIDSIEPKLAKGGPPPLGAQKAWLDPTTFLIIEEFGYQELGHLRAIIDKIGGFPRPLLNLSRAVFADAINKAVGYKLTPPFDPYANSLNYLIACYMIPYVGLNGYVGALPYLQKPSSRALVAGLLAVESGQDAVVRTLLYERAYMIVMPYGITVAELTNKISILRNILGNCGLKDEGLIVPKELGAENRTNSNIISADYYSLAYPRTPQEIFRIVYGTGDESKPGGFYPHGGNGKIAKQFLRAEE